MICKVELRAELEKSRAVGVLTGRFAELAEKAVRGWYAQRSASGWAYAVDEVVGLFRIKLMRNWQKLDPERNLFAALTKMGRNCGMDWQRKQDSRRRRERLAGGTGDV